MLYTLELIFGSRILLDPTCVHIIELLRYERLDKLHKIGTEFYIFTPLLTPGQDNSRPKITISEDRKKIFRDTSSDKHG